MISKKKAAEKSIHNSSRAAFLHFIVLPATATCTYVSTHAGGSRYGWPYLNPACLESLARRALVRKNKFQTGRWERGRCDGVKRGGDSPAERKRRKANVKAERKKERRTREGGTAAYGRGIGLVRCTFLLAVPSLPPRFPLDPSESLFARRDATRGRRKKRRPEKKTRSRTRTRVW